MVENATTHFDQESKNMNELHELEELKTVYNLMDLRLDNQKIVSDEQLREAMYRKFADFRQYAKEGLIWTNLIFVPILAWWAWSNNSLSLLGIILLGVYWVASLIFRFVILRRTKKEDYGSYNLKSLVEKEANYSRNIKWGNIISVIFLMVFFSQLFWGKEGSEFVLFIILAFGLLALITVRRKMDVSYKYKGQALDPVTGKPRKSTRKWVTIVSLVIFALACCLMTVAFVMTAANSTGWLGLLRILQFAAYLIAIVVFILGLHKGGTINVSRRLLVILTVIAIALSVSVTGIAALMGFTELTQSMNLLMTAALSAMGLANHKMRKE